MRRSRTLERQRQELDLLDQGTCMIPPGRRSHDDEAVAMQPRGSAAAALACAARRGTASCWCACTAHHDCLGHRGRLRPEGE